MENHVYVDFSYKGIRLRREELGITRQDISDLTGIPVRTIESYEQNPTTNRAERLPSPDKAELLAEALQCWFRIAFTKTDITEKLNALLGRVVRLA